MPEIRIPLVKNTISVEDIAALSEWLNSGPRLTKGELTLEFESVWSTWQGRKHSLFVNSGSSANLAMFYALIVAGRLANKKVIVPSVAWATTVSPIIQFGLTPIVCECDRETLGLDIPHFKKLVTEHKPACVVIVHVLGFPNKMNEIAEICSENDLILIEDSCESVGSTYHGTKTGNFGLMSSFSLYYGHHLSTIEGGLICTDDEELADLLLALRGHGWDRDLAPETQRRLRAKYDIDDFRSLYTFYYPGFNLRSTDLQAFIGLRQMKRIDRIINIRNENFKLYHALIRNDFWKITDHENTFVSNFAYPVITKKIKPVVKWLTDTGIEVRPLVCGSISRQPFYFERYGKQALPFADLVHDFGLYLPNNHELSAEDVRFVSEVINEEL